MFRYFIAIVLLTGIDRGLKVFLAPLLIDGTRITLIPGILGLSYAENTGAGFSILSGKTGFLIVVTVLLLAALLYILFFKKDNSRLFNAALTLVIAGGFGNLYDRVFNGFVVDYFEFLFFEFPIFNFADCLVNIGAALLIIWVLRSDKEKTKE